MKEHLSYKLFRWFVSVVIYNADTRFFTHSMGFRGMNPKATWFRENLIQLWEEALGKEYFVSEYSKTGDIFKNDSDYLGTILKANFWYEAGNFYLREFYRTGKNPEFAATIEVYIKNNPKECYKLFSRVVKKKIRRVLVNIYRSAIERFDLAEMKLYKRSINNIKATYKDKAVGVAVGFGHNYLVDYFKPIMNEFIQRDKPFIYIFEQNRWPFKKTELVHDENNVFLKVRLPTSREVFKNKKYTEGYKNDFKLLKNRISFSKIESNYKLFIINRLNKYLKRYYKIRFFLDEFVKDINVGFAFALPDRFDFQRTMLMLCKRRNIPTFTYEAFFNFGITLDQWFYFSDWVLLPNRRYADMIAESGFSKDRVLNVGSTLADRHMFNTESSDSVSSDVIKILLLTKPARITGTDNCIIINETLKILEGLNLKYTLYLKPHPADKDSYSTYIKTYKDKIFLLDRQQPLYIYAPRMDGLVICGMSVAIFECLPARKPMFVIDQAINIYKDILYREDFKKIVSLFESLDDYRKYFHWFINNLVNNIQTKMDIPLSIIDDFYVSLDGRTAERVCDFVIAKAGARN